MIERSIEDPSHPRTSLSPVCGNCDYMLGYREWGWCYKWQTFVHGNQDCPSFEMRCYMEETNVKEMLDAMHEGLSKLGEMAESTEDEKVKKDFRVAEIAFLKFLRSLRKQYGVPYDED